MDRLANRAWRQQTVTLIEFRCRNIDGISVDEDRALARIAASGFNDRAGHPIQVRVFDHEELSRLAGRRIGISNGLSKARVRVRPGRAAGAGLDGLELGLELAPAPLRPDSAGF